eukprot:scaffold240993_cov96-Cyclotella_meneghiniana.AAC.4
MLSCIRERNNSVREYSILHYHYNLVSSHEWVQIWLALYITSHIKDIARDHLTVEPPIISPFSGYLKPKNKIKSKR